MESNKNDANLILHCHLKKKNILHKYDIKVSGTLADSSLAEIFYAEYKTHQVFDLGLFSPPILVINEG